LIPALAGSPGSTRKRKKLKVTTTKIVTTAQRALRRNSEPRVIR